MKLIRYQKSFPYIPSVSYHTLLDEVDRLFQVALPSLDLDDSNAFPVDLYQGKDAFRVRAELPGFRKEDLGIEVADRILNITARSPKSEEVEGNETKAPHQECTRQRSISLPENADPTKISALYENGVLTVTLPKQEEVKPKQITVEVK